MPEGLSDLQREVLTLFFALPESDGFVLAGGAALVAAGLSDRLTQDVDLFSTTASIEQAADALQHTLETRGWSVERIQSSETFRRVIVTTTSRDQLLVDLARDAAPLGATLATSVGPTYPPLELAARKLLALFGRAALRDFIDVAHLASQLDRDAMLGLATEIDEGFDLEVFCEMLDTLDRFTDEEITAADPAALRAFFRSWGLELRRRASNSG